jgi:glycosyltransferase involved in cell wall biosynthesis
VTDGARAREALLQRLTAVAGALDIPVPPNGSAAERAAIILVEAVRVLHVEPRRTDRIWLVLTAIAAAYPYEGDVRAAARALELSRPDEAAAWFLESGFRICALRGSPLAEMDLREDVVVDVDFSARNDLHTGIQRVVRQTVPLWQREQPLTLAGWTDRGGALRHLVESERERVLRWTGPTGQATEGGVPTLIVPWRTTVILTEVPSTVTCPALLCLAQLSGNAVSAIGYDCIPIVSADMLPAAEPEKFVHYLTVVKYAARVVAISASAADEFQGFADMLPTQGLRPPDVLECPLPIEVPLTTTSKHDDGVPTVLCVGSHEPRKNHVAVLAASERLWREGLAFRLRLIGGSGWSTETFDRWVHRLRRRRRPVDVARSVGDEALWSAYREARFTVFPSLHEGYGLPVAESLAVGTPAITSDMGSMAEIARDGGALTVDPRDLDALTTAMRTLLMDDDALVELQRHAAARPQRTWNDYAQESWTLLLAGRGAL